MLTLLDLTIDGTTYQYADQPSAAFPDYAPRLNLYSEIEELPGDISRNNQQAERVVRVWLSNTHLDRYATDHPTVNDLIAAGHTITGAAVRVRRYDPASQQTRLDLRGEVVEVGDLAEAVTRITIGSTFAPLPQQLLPTVDLRTVYPSVKAPENQPLGIIFGAVPQGATQPGRCDRPD